MAIQYLTYNDDSMESGKFYIIEANKDLVSNIRDIKSITDPITLNTQQIELLNQFKTDSTQDIQIIDTLSKDNRSRINNLEDRTLDNELMYALDVASIKVTFANETKVEVQHNRKEIYFKKVMAYVGTVGDTENYEDITHAVKLTEQITKNQQGQIISKKMIIESNSPITGYVILL